MLLSLGRTYLCCGVGAGNSWLLLQQKVHEARLQVGFFGPAANARLKAKARVKGDDSRRACLTASA